MANDRPPKDKEHKQNVSQAKKDIDLLFGGKARKSVEADALRDATGRADRARAAAEYVERWGYPNDIGLLALFLRQSDSELMLGALQKLPELLEHSKSEERALLQSSLESAMLTMSKADSRRAAKHVIELLDAF